MATIYKATRLDPKTGKRVKYAHWRIMYRDESGRRVSVKGFKDKTATEALARDLERRVERIKAGLPVERREKTQQPLDDAMKAFCDDLTRRGCGPDKPHHSESKRILKAIRLACDWQSISAIRTDAFTKYLTDMAQSGSAARTQNRHHETLRNFLNWCVGQGWLEANPIAKMQMVTVGAAGKVHRRRAYTLDEFKRMVETANHHATVIKVAALSGLRRSELRRLEKRDLQPMQWTIRGEVTKNGKAENLPMLVECWEAIRPVWETAAKPASKIFKTIPDMDTLHHNMARAGIERKGDDGRVLDFHSFRYFFCTMLSKKLPIQEVSRLMRHRDIRLTTNIYLDLGLTDLNAAVDRLPRILDTSNIPGSNTAKEEYRNPEQCDKKGA